VAHTQSGSGDHERIDFQLSAIKDAGALDAALLGVGDVLFTLDEREADAPALLHLVLLQLRHALGCKVQPLARAEQSIFWFIVGNRSLSRPKARRA
jgi:hypothetical protein